jgi:hypothetical protein
VRRSRKPETTEELIRRAKETIRRSRQELEDSRIATREFEKAKNRILDTHSELMKLMKSLSQQPKPNIKSQ